MKKDGQSILSDQSSLRRCESSMTFAGTLNLCLRFHSAWCCQDSVPRLKDATEHNTQCANLQVRPGLQWRVHWFICGGLVPANNIFFKKNKSESLPHLQQIISQKVAVTTSDQQWLTPKIHSHHSRLILPAGATSPTFLPARLHLASESASFLLCSLSNDGPFLKWFLFAF